MYHFVNSFSDKFDKTDGLFLFVDVDFALSIETIQELKRRRSDCHLSMCLSPLGFHYDLEAEISSNNPP